MTMSKSPLAKPKGLPLEQHVMNVLLEALQVLAAHPFVVEKYRRLTTKNLGRRVRQAAEYHDDGKTHPKWQGACQKEYEIYQQIGKVNGAYMQQTGIRHEMESLFLNQSKKFSEEVQVAIAAHHGKLGEIFRERWEKDDGGKYQFLWDYFEVLQGAVFKDVTKKSPQLKTALLTNYKFAGVRSYLQLADHRASIKEDSKTVPEFTSFAYTFNPEWTRRPVQQIAEDNWQDDLLLLRAPTGAGKTDACLLWAKKQIENKKADRLVIAMPTRFTSNALAIGVADSLSQTGLYHSSAWFVRHFEDAKASREAEHKARLQHEFARLLETPVTVCTIDHLLMALTHTREDHHSITFNLAHSCLVIDEADFYDEFTQANILELLKALKILDVPVLLMSASLPQSSLELYQKTGYQVAAIKEDTSDNKRVRCKVNGIRDYSAVTEVADIMERSQQQPTIIYANTVDRAIEWYNHLSEIQKEVSGQAKLPITLYHSRFTEPDKARKEKELLDNLGKKAWEENTAKGIAIMTQIGEMSVNINAHYMVSEVCPIDRLVQRIGRLARFDKTIGLLDILIPYKDGTIYPAPYGEYIKGMGWEIGQPLVDSIQLLQCQAYSANDFVALVNQVYAQIPKFSSKAQANADALIEHIINNWLIVPNIKQGEDDQDTNIWKSRNIEEQREVFILNPHGYLDNNPQRLGKAKKHLGKPCFFDSYKEFMYYKNQYSVNCYSNVFRKAREQSQIAESDEVWIGDSKEPFKVWVTDCYDAEYGLNFKMNTNIKS